ncbi:hypothetical protein MP228_006083 [Amoeboaphelidium protococcarum]|nr:hypothetical protein MP228_006083 [Amoeboaphelidium protococcarum]
MNLFVGVVGVISIQKTETGRSNSAYAQGYPLILQCKTFTQTASDASLQVSVWPSSDYEDISSQGLVKPEVGILYQVIGELQCVNGVLTVVAQQMYPRAKYQPGDYIPKASIITLSTIVSVSAGNVVLKASLYGGMDIKFDCQFNPRRYSTLLQKNIIKPDRTLHVSGQLVSLGKDTIVLSYCSLGLVLTSKLASESNFERLGSLQSDDSTSWLFNNSSAQSSSQSTDAPVVNANTNEPEVENQAPVDGQSSTETTRVSKRSHSIIGNNPLNIDPEVLNALDYSGIPQAKLMLKVGVSVMLIRNLNIDAGLVNGTMLKVLTLNRNSIKCQIINGSRKDDIVSIPKIGITVSEFENVEFVCHQFPVRLAFAATINKAQGQTLAKCGIYLQQQVFAHGQLYVAFSRVRSSSDVTVCYEDAPKNIVYQDRAERARDQQSFKGVLGVGFKNSEGRYTSSVTCIEKHRLNRYEVIAVASESEVFKQLQTRWTIMPLDATSSTDDACRVRFVIDYQFKSVLHDAMAGFFFNEVALKMVDAFKVEAHSRMKRLQK